MILDTSAVSALLAGDPGIADVLGAEPRHHLPVIVLGEYRYGLRRSSRRSALAPLLDLLAAESRVLGIDERTAETYAEAVLRSSRSARWLACRCVPRRSWT